MELVLPASKYKISFLVALEEYQKEQTITTVDLLALRKKDLEKDFNSYIKQLEDAAVGENLPNGYVAHTTYWFVEREEFIGRVDIRHTLTAHLRRKGGHIGYDVRPSKRKRGYGKKLLTLALPKAKELGITKVLVTCDETNIASKKIIESNGGAFEERVDLGEDRPWKLLYWFDLS